MNSITKSQCKSKTFLFYVLMLFLALTIAIFFDVPIVRETLGFVYFTFVPGFIFLKLLSSNRFNRLETVLLSVGLSVAYLMIAGLFVNEIFSIFGISHPLSLMPLMVILNIPVLIGCIVICKKGEFIEIGEIYERKSIVPILVFFSLPLLSILGTTAVNVQGDNSILLFLLLLISALVILSVLSERILPSNLYPIALLMIGLSILFHSSLISSYIVPFGSDIPGEYLLFQNTLNNSQWTSIIPTSIGSTLLNTYNNMLSVTILPTVYTILLNVDSSILFKVLYPLIFSLVPVVLYTVWQEYVDKKYAFLATFLFMAQMTFYTEMLGLARQMIAELFFVLLLFVILNKKIQPITKTICFIIFSFGLVASHYSLAVLFLFFISAVLCFFVLYKRPCTNITVSLVVIFFIIMFTWYIYTSGSASFTTLLDKADFVSSKLGGFFNLASRGTGVLAGLGLTESPSIWNTISRNVAYVVQAFIIVGFLGLITKIKEIKSEFFVFSIIATLFLGALIAVPGLADTLNMTRFFHILLFFLAPLCVIGARSILKIILKHEKQFVVCILLLVVLVPYFLFQTNFVYEVTGSDSWSIPLSSYRMDAARLYGHYGYTDKHSFSSSQWLSENVNLTNSKIYADQRTIANVLTIYSLGSRKISLSNVTIVDDGGYIYLSTLNVLFDRYPFNNIALNSSELSVNFDELSLLYTNGNSKIYLK
ncbi:MAG: DUF2206 domain-containing protein [Candidatus Bathyarchaeota archaeon]|nr:MAG: DUF2206 domain-containing protein [Candidatus Bathyarchaeota archaeon]